ncbi:hypothetical protein E0K93_18030 [Puniceibacterium sp. HSS470]|nr:hypothetical protein E0K93_18030 [Puniceibacterium sp. HSS470]|tara:strand:+ start:48976 stop:49215 length:240 start_codon:yes stop_codon:yes gene_type:complete
MLRALSIPGVIGNAARAVAVPGASELLPQPRSGFSEGVSDACQSQNFTAIPKAVEHQNDGQAAREKEHDEWHGWSPLIF